MSRKKQFTVLPEHCDHFGLITYNVYLDWANESKKDFLYNAGCSIEEFENKGINLVTVNMNLRCMEACFEGDKVTVETLTDKVNDHSIYFTFIAKNLISQDTIFKVDSEVYAVDEKGRTVRFPDEDFEKLKGTVEI